jgi:hypothetical protein
MEHTIIKDQKELRRFEEFLKTPGKRLLFNHRDADGICSAALLLKFFGDFESNARQGPRIEREFVKEIVEKKPDMIVFLDLPVDQEWDKIKEILEKLPKTRMVVVDHHINVYLFSNGGEILIHVFLSRSEQIWGKTHNGRGPDLLGMFSQAFGLNHVAVPHMNNDGNPVTDFRDRYFGDLFPLFRREASELASCPAYHKSMDSIVTEAPNNSS